jgi:hypothetical protein
MSNKLQVKRDTTEVGDEVYVVRHSGGRTWRKHARVLSTNRAAVKVRYDDGEETIVQLRYIERVERTEPVKRPEPPTRTTDAPPRVTLAPPPAPPTMEPSEISPPRSEIDAFFAMGRDLAPMIRAEMSDLEQEEQSLRDDAADMVRQAEVARLKRAELGDKLKLIEGLAR